MSNIHLVSPLGYRKLKYKKNIDKLLFKSNWIILQYVGEFESKINRLVSAIVVDDLNCMDVIDKLPKNKKILIIANKEKSRIIYKICRSKKIKAWILKKTN